MCFILLSIALFVLRTLTIFEIADYDFVTVYVAENLTGQTLVNSIQQRDVLSSFDTLEWICIKEKNFVLKYFFFF